MSAFEKSLQSSVLKFLKERGHVAFNIHGNEFSQGVPDILCGVCGLFVALELKSAEGSLTPLQKANLVMIRKRGCIAEAVQTIEHVKRITETIEAGEKWEATPL
jgi:Holliday junction resolvase